MSGLIAQFIRFLGIGFLNTAIDFVMLNSMMFYFGVFTGITVGLFSAVSFLVAVTHSYFWNRYLVFKKTEQSGGLFSNLGEFIFAGVLGALVIFASLFGADKHFSFLYFLALLGFLLIGELIFWFSFRVGQNSPAQKSSSEYLIFAGITLVGLFLNAGIVSAVTANVPPQYGLNQELWTNLVKALATGVSLVWNFAGYKILLFKK